MDTQNARADPVREADAGTGYDAFMSYSRKDELVAKHLHRRLMWYKSPNGLPLACRRLVVFRDVEDLVGTELPRAIEDAIGRSRKLIVICSPRARHSKWVAKEIRNFIKLHGPAGIVPVLVDGRPNSEVGIDDPTQDQAFADCLLEGLVEPLACDFRMISGEGALGRRERLNAAWFQLLATLFNTDKDRLLRRQQQRRHRQVAAALTVSLALTAFFAWLAILASRNAREARQQQRIAQIQRAIAEEQAAVATARLLAAEAFRSDDGTAFGQNLGALLGVESLRRHPTPAGTEAVEYMSRRLLRPGLTASVDQSSEIALSASGDWLVVSNTNDLEAADITVWNLAGSLREPAVRFARPHKPDAIAVSNSGDRIATSEFTDGWQVRVFDLFAHREVTGFRAQDSPLTLSGSGRLLAI